MFLTLGGYALVPRSSAWPPASGSSASDYLRGPALRQPARPLYSDLDMFSGLVFWRLDGRRYVVGRATAPSCRVALLGLLCGLMIFRVGWALSRKRRNRSVHALHGNPPLSCPVRHPSAATVPVVNSRTSASSKVFGLEIKWGPIWPAVSAIRDAADVLAQLIVLTLYPRWAVPRFARIPGLDAIAVGDAARVREAVLVGRRRATKRRLLNAVHRITSVCAHVPHDRLRVWLQQFPMERVGDAMIAFWRRAAPAWLLDRLGRASRAISSAVIALAYSRVTATSRRLTFPVSVALVAAVSALHPAVQVLIRAFLAEYPAVCSDTGSAIHTLLRKGPGFIPTPSCADAVFELAGFTCAAAAHPKATLSPDEKAVFFNKVIRLARTMLLPQNLSHELRSCLQDAKKTLGFVFVETDKTGQLVKVP